MLEGSSKRKGLGPGAFTHNSIGGQDQVRGRFGSDSERGESSTNGACHMPEVSTKGPPIRIARGLGRLESHPRGQTGSPNGRPEGEAHHHKCIPKVSAELELGPPSGLGDHVKKQ